MRLIDLCDAPPSSYGAASSIEGVPTCSNVRARMIPRRDLAAVGQSIGYYAAVMAMGLNQDC
jgi:hypothetical protein